MTLSAQGIAVCLIAGFLIPGCGTEEDVDKLDYTRRNDAILDRLPLYPTASLENAFATEERGGPGENSGPIIAYWSERRYAVAGSGSAARIIDFYRRRLRRAGWEVRARTTCERSFRKDDALLAVVACYPAGFSLTVDHAAYRNLERPAS